MYKMYFKTFPNIFLKKIFVNGHIYNNLQAVQKDGIYGVFFIEC